ncbi:hypothetical protein [Streptomyces sp. E-08]|uniref:hypothetical protein n=1 Tax=Streptomyces sp. E-08 TaxID=3404047 RepID=UPI003CEAE56B
MIATRRLTEAGRRTVDEARGTPAAGIVGGATPLSFPCRRVAPYRPRGRASSRSTDGGAT